MTNAPAGLRPFRRLTGKLIGGALVGKLLGFAREIAMAQMLGASIVADSFRGSMTAVMLPLALLQGDIVPAILIPLHGIWRREGHAAKSFASLSAVFLLTAALIMGVVELFADDWIDFIVPGFSPEAHAMTRRFVQVMALAMPASAMFNCLTSVELSLGRSRITAVRSSVQNVGVLAGVIVATFTHQYVLIAWCFTTAFTVTATWGTWSLWREGELDLGAITIRSAIASTCDFLRRLRPLIMQPITEQGSVLIERLLGSASGVGTVASIDYARTLTESAVFLVSQPVGYAVLAGGGTAEGETPRRMEAISRPILSLAMPASVFLLMFAPEIVRIVFMRGAFSDHAVLLTSHSLVGISTGLWAATLGWVLIRLLNAAGRNTRAAFILVFAYVANILVNLVLAPHLGSLGLGLGEAARGVVLLVGTAAALGCLGILLRLMAQVVPFCIVLAALELLVRYALKADYSRVAVGAAVCALVTCSIGATLMPGLMPTLLRSVKARLTFLRPNLDVKPN